MAIKQQEKNRQHAASQIVQASIESMLIVLLQQIKAVKAAIAEHIDQHPDLRDAARSLDSIPGVRETTIRPLLGEPPASVLQLYVAPMPLPV